MATITLTRKNVFSKLSKIMSLLDDAVSVKLQYETKKDNREVIPYPEDSIAYNEAKKRLDNGEYTDLEDLEKMFYEKYPKKEYVSH